MSIDEHHRLAMELPDDQRAALAADLLASLPPVLEDADEGVAEGLRRPGELDRDPSAGVSWDEIKIGLGRG